ncbi:MAG: general secretion pathway protein E [Planctomycetota bacterium]|jgi:general secretion pathway protein E
MEIGERIGEWIRPLYNQFTRKYAEEIEAGRDDPESAVGPAEDATYFMEMLLEDAIRERASDIHFEPYATGVRVRFRIDGVLLDTMSLPLEGGGTMIRHMKALGGLDPVPAARPASAGRTVRVGNRNIEVRTSVAPCVFGEKVVLRMLDLPQQVQHLSALGLNGDDETHIRGWLEHVTGTFVVCGPTGSGKTTTLYSLLHELKNTNRSVVTIEDPVEYRVEGVTQMEVDKHQKVDFDEGLRAMLRLDPDYLMLGEIRDPQTARVAMTAAGTGRVLMTTLHSKDAVGVMTALRNWGIDDFQSASALRVVVAQRLVRRLCPECREEAKVPTEAEDEWLRAIGREPPASLWRAVGCAQCNDLGYRGRVGLFEIWRVNNQDAERILGRVDDHKMRQALRERGHRFLIDDALDKVALGLTDIRQIKQLAGGG